MSTLSFPRRLACVALLLLAPSAVLHAASQPSQVRERLLVLTDVENEPDDTQSLVRLMLYTNEIDVEGLVATTSTWKRNGVAPESIQAVLQAYNQVQANLALHDARYPRASALQAVVKSGSPVYGMSGVGAGKDTEGSEWLLKCLAKDDPRPLWVAVWGGSNTLAQALYKLRATASAAELEKAVAKLRVYAISDQDDSGIWIRNEFPKLFYIVTPRGDYGGSTWNAIAGPIDGIDNTTVSNRWLEENIQQGHGPLGARYPDIAYGMEGDTPSWLNLIPNGLNVPEHPDWGGWGGRYELYKPAYEPLKPGQNAGDVPDQPETRAIWTNAVDTYTPALRGDYGRRMAPGQKTFRDAKVTLWRWRDDLQHDFAARMLWTTKPYAEANHPPVPVLDHPDHFTVKSEQGFALSAHASSDPDGDSLSFLWLPYPEASGYQGPVAIDSAANAVGVWVKAPKVSKVETLHFILCLTDKGKPALTRYKRVVVTVEP